MAKREFAPGLPDPRRFGRITELPIGKPLRYVVQKHMAERAGPHFDIRFGPDKGHLPTLLSWAARKLPEEPGKKTLAFRQPLHTGAYADFEGEITSGYGKGIVKTHDKGAILVTKVTPDKINFVVIHKKHPETFTMIRKSGPPITPKTAREAKTQGGTWLLINTTPTDVIEHKKVHYAKVPAEDVAKLFDKQYLHQEKIDGAAALYRVLSDRIEVLSYRPTTKGRPIVHTYRVGDTTGINIPKHLVGSVLRGELYGIRRSTGRAIPPQELGGILNAATLKSLEKQKEQDVELRSRLFNVLQYGKDPVGMETPLEERLTKLKEIMQHLPSPKFGLPEMAGTPEEQRELWERIAAGKHPLTSEGIVAWPKAGGKPTKVKLYDEADVFVREIFPGKGRLAGAGAGGFKYSLKPGAPIVGEVGTGLTEATRKQMWESPEEFIGRVARIKAQGQFPSGAYRAPGLIAFHEDYPAAKAAALVKAAYDPLLAAYEARAYDPTTLKGVAGELGMTAGTVPAASTAWEVGKHAIGRGKGKLGAAVASKWAPAALKSQLGRAFGSWMLPITIGLEAAGGLYGATQDPAYRAGEIGYLRSIGRELGRRSDVSQAKAQEAYESSLLGGAASSALQGMSNPIATTMALIQASGRALAAPFKSKKADSEVLGPVIKRAIANLGGSGNTMDDLVKSAYDYAKRVPPPMPKSVATELGVKSPVSLGDRIRALVLGIKPEEIKSLRAGAQTLANVVDRVRSLGVTS